MNAVMKFLVIPAAAAAVLVMASGSFADDKEPNPAAGLADDLITDTSVVGVIGGKANTVAIIFNAEPNDELLAKVCTAADARKFTSIQKVIAGQSGHELVNICQ